MEPDSMCLGFLCLTLRFSLRTSARTASFFFLRSSVSRLKTHIVSGKKLVVKHMVFYRFGAIFCCYFRKKRRIMGLVFDAYD
jgi:hypothetical protein